MAMQNPQELAVPISFSRLDDCVHIDIGCPKNTEIWSKHFQKFTLSNLLLHDATIRQQS